MSVSYNFKSMTYSELMSLANKIDPKAGFYVEFTVQQNSGSLVTMRAFDKATAKQIILTYEGKVFKAMLKRKF